MVEKSYQPVLRKNSVEEGEEGLKEPERSKTAQEKPTESSYLATVGIIEIELPTRELS